MKVRIPLALASAFVVLMVLAFFSPKLNGIYGGRVSNGLFIFMAFAVVPAIVSLIRLHWTRIRRKHPDALYSAIALIAMAVTLFCGFVIDGIVKQKGFGGPSFSWIVSYVFEPLQQAVFAFLAFFIVSAAYRAFRAKTLEATLLLIAAVIVLIGNAIVPLPGPGGSAELWLLAVPSMAVQRGIILGVALGIVAQSVRILLGLERGFVGRG